MQAIDDIVRQPLPMRLQAMERLWDSMRDEPEGIPAWHAGVLAQRVADLDSGQEAVSDWGSAKIRIRERIKIFSPVQ